MASVTTEDFIEPAGVGLGVFGGDNFDDVALLKFGFEIDHFAVDDGASTCGADFAMEAIGEIEWHGAFGQVDNVAFWGIDEDFVGEKIKFELLFVDFFRPEASLAADSWSSRIQRRLEGKFTDAAFGVGGGELLLIIEEGGGQPALGIIVHFLGANLKFDDLFVVSDDRSMERLVAVLLWHGDVIFDASFHWMEEGMNDAENEIAGCSVFNDEA